MSLKAVVESLDDVPEALRELYTETDGKFLLDIDGDSIKDHPSTSGLRKNAETILAEKKKVADRVKQLEADIKRFEGIDPEKANEALAKLTELEDKELIDENKIEELVERRVKRIKDDAEARIRAAVEEKEKIVQEREALHGQLSETLIFNTIKDAALKRGVRETALDDVVNRGRSVWKLEEGKPIAYKGDGEIDYGKSGEPITPDEWVEALAGTAPHLFKESTGGGSQGSENQTRSPKIIDLAQTGGMIGEESLRALAEGVATLRQ